MSQSEKKTKHQGEREELERHLVGRVWVDSGQLVLTDPVYLDQLDVETVGAATDLKDRAGLVTDGIAVAFRSGIRIGRYPVYVTQFKNGAIAGVEVDMREGSDPAGS